MFQKILTIIIYVLVFLLPLFWLPFSVEGFEFNKNYLLVFLVSFGLLVWFAKMIFKENKIYFKRTPLDLFIFLFLIATFLTVIFSKDRIASIFGFYGSAWPNLIGILCLIGFYFLVSNNIEDKDQEQEIKDKQGLENKDLKSIIRNSLFVPLLSISSLIKVFLCSFALVILSTYFFLLKIWPNKFFNLTSQSFEGLAMFLTIVFVFLISHLAFAKKRNIWLYFLLFIIFPLIVLIDFWPAWFVLCFSLFLFLSFAFWKRIFREHIGRLNLIVIFSLISLSCLFFNPFKDFFQKIPELNNLPKENILSQKTSWLITWNGLKENAIFGSGSGTFSYLFNKFKPESFLNTSFWQTRFNKSGNHFAEIAGTTGVLGILSYLVLIIMFLLFSVVVLETRIKKSQTSAQGNCLRAINFQFPLLMGFTACLLSQFVYYQNTTLAFLFWFFLILNVLSWKAQQQEYVFDFKDFPEVKLVFTTLFYLILIAAIFFYFMMAKYYLADVYYKEYLQKPTTENLNKLEQAIGFNNYEPQYQTGLSQAYLGEAIKEFNKNPQDNQLIIKRIDAAIKSSQQAIKIAPNRVAFHETSGVIYSQIQGLSQGALEWGIKSFENALKCEPKNPILLTELGKLKIQENKEEEAKILFEKALKLKSDYPEAIMRLALLEEKQDKKDSAIKRIEELVGKNPYSAEARFQLGRLYYNQGEDEKAFTQFQNAIILFPNHSNSHYALALLYEKKGEKENALKEFEKVLELNPGNKDIIGKIKQITDNR